MSHRSRKSDPDRPIVPPIAFKPASNGEFCPEPETERDRLAYKTFLRYVEDKHKRLGMSRREFAQSACGMATALLVINQVYGCSSSDQANQQGVGSAGSGNGPTGDPSDAGSGTGMNPTMNPGSSADGGYDVNENMMEDEDQACEKLGGDEFIFDVQVHVATPLAPWDGNLLPMRAVDFVNTIFVDSDTDVCCLTGVPGARSGGIDVVRARDEFQKIIDLVGGARLVFHANIEPSLGASELDYMEEVAASYSPAAWKTYPMSGNYRMNADGGLAFVERARQLGINLIASHRGISGNDTYSDDNSPADVVSAAAQVPDVNFLMYHGGFGDVAVDSVPFNPNEAEPSGVNRTVKALIDNGFSPNQGNVYAELGTTWHRIKSDPTAAAHVIGKLLKYLGEDRILWGTDCVFNGAPQEQIVAFRAFQIPESLQDAHGYPALTPEIKRKIFGLNAVGPYGFDLAAKCTAITGDFVDQIQTMGRNEMRGKDPRRPFMPEPHYYGPKTRREFAQLMRWEKVFGHG